MIHPIHPMAGRGFDCEFQILVFPPGFLCFPRKEQQGQFSRKNTQICILAFYSEIDRKQLSPVLKMKPVSQINTFLFKQYGIF